MRILHLGWLLVLSLIASVAQGYDQRWPDFGVVAGGEGNAGTATYFQGFESACFDAPPNPAPGETDWVSYYSQVVRVASGTNGTPSRNGAFHAEIRPPLPGAPGPNTGAFTRLGGYRSSFGGGFTVEIDTYFDLADPRVTSGINADYGWDASAAINDQAGAHRRDFIFHTASNTSGQILVGTSTISNFAPKPDLAMRPNYVVTTSGWYTLQWVFRDAGGTLAVDLNLRSSAGALLFTQTISDPMDLIAQIGGNRYLWYTFVQSNRLPIDNVRLNSAVREALYASTPVPGSTVNTGSTTVGGTTPGVPVNVQNQGNLDLEICSCTITGTNASDFTVSACPTLIPPAGNATLNVSCSPSAQGPRTATLTLQTNDSTRGTSFAYTLQCNGFGLNTTAVPVDQPWALLLLTLSLLGVGAFVVRVRST